jgi:hypothetical protein
MRGCPVASDQIDFALGSAWQVVSRHKNVSLPPQIPTRERLAAYAALSCFCFRIGERFNFPRQTAARAPVHNLVDEPRYDRHAALLPRRQL